ncbi:PH domain-containing protein [Streptodolium elevatio]|uniref:PH domain-containing protein n=1 Tax=Streptodolium elevatio TaxID=3157996 RepID=A0ABV3DBB1_9ACTN
MHEIRMVLGLRQRFMWLVLGIVFALLGVYMLIIEESYFFLVLAVLQVALFFWSARFSTVVHADGLTAVGLRTRRLAWQDIANVEAKSLLGTRGVRLTLVSGRRVRLHVPATGGGANDPDFDVKLATISQWWAVATGRMAPEQQQAGLARYAGQPPTGYPGR